MTANLRRPMRSFRIVGAIVTLLVGLPIAASCTADRAGCHTWELFETPEEARLSSDSVVVGRVVDVASSQHMFGVPANVWNVSVDEWLKGDGPSEIQVVSPPDACGPERTPYIADDPFAAGSGSPVVIFLQKVDPNWVALSPFQGVLPVTGQGDAIPTEWPPSLRPRPAP